MVLTGREALLAGRAPGPGLVALCGLGGAGKTSAAIEYAYRHPAEFGVFWQLPAEDLAVLAAEFAVLAAQLGAREVVDARPGHIGTRRLGQGTCPLAADLRQRPGLGVGQAVSPPAGDGRVLVTTQSQHWPPGQALDVPGLDPDVAAAFLVNRTGDTDQVAAADLAVELGGLPLALGQAAAYMQVTDTPLARYLPLFKARQADLLARGEAAGQVSIRRRKQGPQRGESGQWLEFSVSGEDAGGPRDDLGLTDGDWATLQFAYNYGTMEPIECTVEAEAFRRMNDWNRQETVRQVRQEELDAASQQSFPGGPLLGTPEAGMPGWPGTEMRADFEAEL